MAREKPISVVRWVSYVAVVFAIWVGFFLWRPPGPILQLRHIEHLGRESPQVSLTIDDGPHPLTTPLLLASLKRSKVRATFFVVGDGLRLYPELARRIVEDGHLLANHSQNHHNLTSISKEDFSHEIDAAFVSIERAYSLDRKRSGEPPRTRLFRPPGGGMNRATMQYLYDNNVALAWWSNNCGDWARPPAWKIADQVKATLRPGDIILLHDAGTGTPQAIPAIVKHARRQGLEFVPMPEGRQGG